MLPARTMSLFPSPLMSRTTKLRAGENCARIGSASKAGLIVAEGNVAALAVALRRLQNDSGLRADLINKGRARVLEHFTQKRIAEETVKVYREMMTR